MRKHGKLAHKYCGLLLPVKVLQSAAGFFIGTDDSDGVVSRESEEYWSTQIEAERVLNSGTWSQRSHP